MQASNDHQQQTSSPRISFSAEFLDDDDNNFTSAVRTPDSDPKSLKPPLPPIRIGSSAASTADHQFEFLSGGSKSRGGGHAKMLTADELFFDGKLLPFWQMQQSDRLKQITLKKPKDDKEEDQTNAAAAVIIRSKESEQQQPSTGTAAMGMNWFVDDDPSPRPPKCTVLWKELLRLKKQRPPVASSLSPSSSSSSSSSSLPDVAERESNGGKDRKEGKKKGLERTRSATLRIRPMINVPICSQMKTTTTHHSSLPPFFPVKKGRVLDTR